MQNYASLQETHDPDEQGILIHDAEPTRSKWNHIEDLDSFFSRMYKYHQNHGFFCMFLQRVFELNQFVFVISLTTYLFYGVNYAVLFGYIPSTQKVTLSDVILPLHECVENFTIWTWFFLIIASSVWILKFLVRCYQMVYYWDIKQFYNTALNVQDCDLDNLTWHEIQTKIKAVQLEQEMCIHKRELTELDIYHRILRQENYLVAMVNKRLLPPRVNIPFVGEVVYWTKAMKFNMQLLFFRSPWSPFENSWHLREDYKRLNHRKELAKELGSRVIILTIINVILAPVIFFWQILYTIFSYGEMIKREPGRMGVRTWSLYSKMYLRHFNELEHELHVRLTRAYRPASKYLEAFNSPVVTEIAQHIGFLCGSVFTVIIALTIYDEDVISVEHVITLMTGLGGMTAICRALIPDETTIWCPEYLLQCVVLHTHYLPSGWRGQAHTSTIREEFQQLFQMRVVGLLEELFSPLLTPYFMYRWIYPRSQEIVDFFRNFTVSVVGVGDVCSFAQMDVKKHGNPEWQKESLFEDEEAPKTSNQYTQAENGKIELSLMHFTTTNPSWVPPPDAQVFVHSVQEEYDLSDDSDPQFFKSYANLLDTGSLPDMEVRSTRTKSVFIPDPLRGGSTSDIRKSVRMAEGPSVLGPINMRSSAIVLHDRFYQQSLRQTQSFAETTPLLTPKTQ
nr:autophagy-related protein 9A-like [Leptinotarsa decemlineata]XP_023014109.1 autophagy-related protein 9A-like [Leptinotarsa decemlineata]